MHTYTHTRGTALWRTNLYEKKSIGKTDRIYLARLSRVVWKSISHINLYLSRTQTRQGHYFFIPQYRCRRHIFVPSVLLLAHARALFTIHIVHGAINIIMSAVFFTTTP